MAGNHRAERALPGASAFSRKSLWPAEYKGGLERPGASAHPILEESIKEALAWKEARADETNT